MGAWLMCCILWVSVRIPDKGSIIRAHILRTPGCSIKEVVISQRVQVPSISGLWSQLLLWVWFLEPETFNIRYLDPLGVCTYCTWLLGRCSLLWHLDPYGILDNDYDSSLKECRDRYERSQRWYV